MQGWSLWIWSVHLIVFEIRLKNSFHWISTFRVFDLISFVFFLNQAISSSQSNQYDQCGNSSVHYSSPNKWQEKKREKPAMDLISLIFCLGYERGRNVKLAMTADIIRFLLAQDQFGNSIMCVCVCVVCQFFWFSLRLHFYAQAILQCIQYSIWKTDILCALDEIHFHRIAQVTREFRFKTEKSCFAKTLTN